MEQEITNKLTTSEMKETMESLFPENKEYIDSIGVYLADTFSKIDGFDYRWNSLITSNPLLFEDVDYVRVRNFVNNTCTQEEIEAYKSGKLRDLYSSFESLLICNLRFYDRIMSFCTMVFLHYVRINENTCVRDKLDNLPMYLEMTPTQIWCAALTSDKSTKWELEYAWKHSKKSPLKIVPTDGKSWLEVNFKNLYNNKIFARFLEYASVRVDLSGFRQVFYNDITSNHKLSLVCSKFTKTSVAIDETKLDSINEYRYNSDLKDLPLFKKLDEILSENYQKEEYSIYVFNNEFMINTKKFKMIVKKTTDGKISKEYIANTYECFKFEEVLKESINAQYNWAMIKDKIDYTFEKQLLITMLFNMLGGFNDKDTSFRDIKCIKRMPNSDMYCEITFKGRYNRLLAKEVYIHNGTIVYENYYDKGKLNLATIIVNRGYYIFGTEQDINILLKLDITKESFVKHYINYCVPVMQYMEDIISLNIKNKNDIIDVLVNNNYLNPLKINNKNIKFTRLKSNSINNRDIMNQVKKISKNNTSTEIQKLTYYGVIK